MSPSPASTLLLHPLFCSRVILELFEVAISGIAICILEVALLVFGALLAFAMLRASAN